MPYVPTVRKPTGKPAAPLIMVSGPPKSGKSAVSYRLANSDRIDRCFVLDLGEGSADEYAQLGDYEVVEWGRSWSDLIDSIRWCIDQKVADGKLNAVIVDSGSEVWDGLKARADKRARNSRKNKAALAQDPDFEVDISMPFWNDAKDTWARVVSPLKLAGHIVGVVIVRSDEVAEVVNGAPTNRKVISYQCEKTLPAIVTAHVAVQPDHSSWLTEVRSMHVSVTGRGVRLDDENPLDHLLAMLSPDNSFEAPVVVAPIDDQREGDFVAVSAEQAQMLADLFASMQDEEIRVGLKRRFLDVFNTAPAGLPVTRFDEAVDWLTAALLRLSPDQPADATPSEAPGDVAPVAGEAPGEATPGEVAAETDAATAAMLVAAGQAILDATEPVDMTEEQMVASLFPGAS